MENPTSYVESLDGTDVDSTTALVMRVSYTGNLTPVDYIPLISQNFLYLFSSPCIPVRTLCWRMKRIRIFGVLRCMLVTWPLILGSRKKEYATQIP